MTDLYLDTFGLSEAPFSITPDPAFVYLSQRHRDALAHLLYGVGQGGAGGFVQLTGEVGTGKTTLCRCLLEQTPPGTHIALVLNPFMNPSELLAAICEELHIDTIGVENSTKTLVDRLTRFLLDAHQHGERVVVVIDEAQNLSPEALEQIRLLTNLETSKEKLLQIILLGQPELRELLQRRSLRQLAQRITARYHLTPLGPEDTARYVRHRLDVAGAARNPFRPAAMRALFQRSQGVPRLINIIADRALVAAYATERADIDARMVHEAADEVLMGEPGVVRRPPWRALAWAAGLVVAVGLAWQIWPDRAPPPVEPANTEQAATEPPGGTGPGTAAAAIPPATVSVEPREPDPRDPGLDDAWLARQSAAAWLGLAMAWGRPSDAALMQSSCRDGGGLGYACLQGQGSWARLQRLGLPVVLQLPGEQPRELLLLGISEDRVLAGGPEEARWVDKRDVETAWLGDYRVVWPQAPNWPREIGQGDAGPAVETVLMLARAVDPPWDGPARFDAEFERWLRRFQARHGLDADGIIGPETLLYLVSFSIEQPRLRTAGSGDG